MFQTNLIKQLGIQMCIEEHENGRMNEKIKANKSTYTLTKRLEKIEGQRKIKKEIKIVL